MHVSRQLTTVPPPGTSLSAAELIEYLVDLGGALLASGCPTHRAEQLLSEIAEMEGFRAEAFAVPSGLFLSLEGPGIDQPLVRMHRVNEWATDLSRLARLDALFNDVLARKLSLVEARKILDDIERQPPLYSAIEGLLAGTGAAGAAAVFFRGTLLEVGVAAVGGLLVSLVRAFLARRRRTALMGDFVGAAIAATVAWAAGVIWPGAISREVVVLSVVILLVPGMALTTGLTEVVHKNIVSGAAKLTETMVAFLSIVFGIAVMVAVEGLVGGSPAKSMPPHGEPGLLMNGAALLVTSACFCVIFQVPRRLVAGAMLSGAVGWVVTGLGVRYLPGSLSAFTASFSVAVLANGIARLTSRPAQVFLLPGLVLLVPGSFGFVSLESFLRGDFLPGAAKAFEMFLTASAIVTGLLAANVVLPARKLL